MTWSTQGCGSRGFRRTKMRVRKRRDGHAGKKEAEMMNARFHDLALKCEFARPKNTALRGTINLYSSLDLSSFSLYMYRTLCLKTKRLGSESRFTLMQFLSYHSIIPRSCSPSCRTTTMGVLFCICFK